MYALLFRDHGLSPAAISSLFLLWSSVAVLTEVPSGALADVVPRRLLLALGAAITAVGFACWMLAPSYPGFAAGFVLWGVGGSLRSGTFEALLYDELAARGAADRYARLKGRAEAAGTVAAVMAMAAASPLMAAGGYVLVGWTSVVAAALQAGFAGALPPAPAVAAEDPASEADGPYLAVLRSGLREAGRHAPVRAAVVASALLTGLLAIDEYFPLVAEASGIATTQVPIAMALAFAGQAVGFALAGRTAGVAGPVLAPVLLLAVGLLAAGAVSGHPVGFAAVALGYAVASNVMVVADTRLQEVIEGRVRATISSVAGLSSEVVAVVTFAGFAVGSAWVPLGVLVALACAPLVAVAGSVARWPARPGPAVAATGEVDVLEHSD